MPWARVVPRKQAQPNGQGPCQRPDKIPYIVSYQRPHTRPDRLPCYHTTEHTTYPTIYHSEGHPTGQVVARNSRSSATMKYVQGPCQGPDQIPYIVPYQRPHIRSGLLSVALYKAPALQKERFDANEKVLRYGEIAKLLTGKKPHSWPRPSHRPSSIPSSSWTEHCWRRSTRKARSGFPASRRRAGTPIRSDSLRTSGWTAPGCSRPRSDRSGSTESRDQSHALGTSPFPGVAKTDLS